MKNWIPAPSTHSAMLRAGFAQDRFRGNDNIMKGIYYG